MLQDSCRGQRPSHRLDTRWYPRERQLEFCCGRKVRPSRKRVYSLVGTCSQPQSSRKAEAMMPLPIASATFRPGWTRSRSWGLSAPCASAASPRIRQFSPPSKVPRYVDLSGRGATLLAKKRETAIASACHAGPSSHSCLACVMQEPLDHAPQPEHVHYPIVCSIAEDILKYVWRSGA
eukprot:scaffold3499_cov247-Pinguiococcus_pyrenoidosus.AAC.2